MIVLQAFLNSFNFCVLNFFGLSIAENKSIKSDFILGKTTWVSGSPSLTLYSITYGLPSDIIKPKFTINSENEKIAVTAKEGNFISENKILLKKDVIFRSKKFKIMSDDVIFDKKYLTASSSKKSKFISKKTSIVSNGFEIIDNGNKINFNGKTILIIKWQKFSLFF